MSGPKMPNNADLFAKRGDSWQMNRRQRKREFGVEDYSSPDNLSSSVFGLADLSTAAARLADEKQLDQHKARMERQALAKARAAMEGPMTSSDGSRRRGTGAVLKVKAAIREAEDAKRAERFIADERRRRADEEAFIASLYCRPPEKDG